MSLLKSPLVWTIFTVGGMLFTGTINTVVKKLQNNWVAPGLYERPHKFEHPWFQTLVMFIGELLCIFGLIIERRNLRKRKLSIVSINDDDQKVAKNVFSWNFILPTIGDIGGSSLAGIGLLWVSASIWQMMRGSIIIFSGILSVLFLKKKLEKHHWAGMVVVVLGLSIVGVSGFLAESGEESDTSGLLGIGIVLILAGQLMNAIQMVMEESFLKKGNYSPLNVVGMEGLFGTIIMILLVLPLCYFIPGDDAGSYENFFDAIIQMGNSVGLLMLNFAYLLSIAFYNYFGLTVAKDLSTVHRTLIDALRTILVWLSSIIIYYAGAKSLGEPWRGKYSLLQLLGFVFLLVGTSLYNGSYKSIIKLFCIKVLRRKNYGEEVKKPEDEPLLEDEQLKSVS